MLPRRRCPFCRRWYHPNPRLKRRQQTCGRVECRRQQRQKSNRQWRAKNPDYFRGVYSHQKEKYGTRADYMRHYRQQHPDYVRRNATFVRKWREQLGQPAVSYTSPDLQPNRSARKDFQSRIAVSHTSCDIVVNLLPTKDYREVSG
jgi:hypothetical protein